MSKAKMDRSTLRSTKYNSLIQAGYNAPTARKFRDKSFSDVAELIKRSSKIKYKEKVKSVYKITRGYGKTSKESKVISRYKTEVIKDYKIREAGFTYLDISEAPKPYKSRYNYLCTYETVDKEGNHLIDYMAIVKSIKMSRIEIEEKVLEHYKKDILGHYKDKGKILKSKIKIIYCYYNPDPIV